MSNISEKILKQRERIQKQAYFVLCLILVVGMGFYSYTKYLKFSTSLKGVEQNRTTISSIKNILDTEKDIYDKNMKSFSESSAVIQKQVETVFPKEDQYTDLTREIDLIEKTLGGMDYFSVSNIEYQKPNQTEYYSVLPIRMNIKSSAQNFVTFLHLIENSGAMDDQVRLMDMSSIRLNFDKNQKKYAGAPQEIINFSVLLNAYFQK